MTTGKFSAETYLVDLREFQRRTVDQVVEAFYGGNPRSRYLVADETGLGKSLVARGVIASAIERLQDVDRIKRIDVVYICSNADVARQNVKRLDIRGNKVDLATRLSLLAATTHKLDTPDAEVGKPVNLISLTPGTSFPDKGWRTGTADERALLYLILRDHMGKKWRKAEKSAAQEILRGTVKNLDRFKEQVKQYEEGLNGQALDPTIIARFQDLVRKPGPDGQSVLDTFQELVHDSVRKFRRPEVPGGSDEAANVVIELRKTLARAGVEALEPDLVILDEFQRFTDLLRNDTPVSELANEIFEYSDAKVLLLSATPYKPYDLDSAIDGGSGGADSHRDQFEDTLDFLCRSGVNGHSGDLESKEVLSLLAEFRTAVTAGVDPAELREQLREALLKVMCRTERPSTAAASMVCEQKLAAAPVSASDVTQYIRLTELADLVGSSLPIDVWKSVPELVHFMDAYQLGQRVKKERDNPEVVAKLQQLRRLDPEALKRYDEIPDPNPRLKALIDETTGKGWHRLLWLPPSLPYLEPAGAYASPDLRSVTKKLVFSQWSATPTAVASLLSYDARRRIIADAGGEAQLESGNVQLRFRRGDLSSMANFMLFLPLPDLAEQSDPLKLAGADSGPIDAPTAEDRLATTFAGRLPAAAEEVSSPDVLDLLWKWPLQNEGKRFREAVWSRAGLLRADTAMAPKAQAKTDRDGEDAESRSAISEYLQAAISAADDKSGLNLDRIPHDLDLHTARLGMHSPANCAWRALGRLDVDTSKVSDAARWRAAAILAAGLRTVFSRPETAAILDGLYPEKTPYWRKVLQYSADGNLQAVLDEYLFHTRAVEGDRVVDDESIIKFAQDAAQAMRLREATYRGKNPLTDESDLDFPSRFALRYGDQKVEEGSVRSTEVREAFNSPFAPFVLVTTSVGQEGIDFHPWCHNLVHWNIPSSPVDFEQRDGRVNRFRGHAVRRNIAHEHAGEMLESANPWAKAYALATEDAPHQQELPGLAPDWVYPGPHKVLRQVMPYQLSTDEAKIDRVRKRVAYYRLAFGQARQEDLIAAVRAAGLTDEQAERRRVDLTP